MKVLRILQTIEVVEADSIDDVRIGLGKVVRACSHPLIFPLESPTSILGHSVDVNPVARLRWLHQLDEVQKVMTQISLTPECPPWIMKDCDRIRESSERLATAISGSSTTVDLLELDQHQGKDRPLAVRVGLQDTFQPLPAGR